MGEHKTSYREIEHFTDIEAWKIDREISGKLYRIIKMLHDEKKYWLGSHKSKAVVLFLISLLLSLNLTRCERVQRAREKGKVVIGTYLQPAPLDPLMTRGTISAALVDLLYNSPVRLSERFEPVPELAESWEIRGDGVRWILHLRRGVLFHDGEEFGAEDVVFTYKTLKRLRGDEFENLKEIRKIDRYTVEITLKQADVVSLLYWLRTPIVSRRSYPGAEGIKAVGTGPFKLKEWMADDRIVFESNGDYFEGEPEVQQIVVRIYEGYEALLSAFLQGQVDVPYLIDAADVRLVEDNPKFQVSRVPNFHYYAVLFNLRDPLFKGKKMRRALCYAVDREELLRTALMGRGTLVYSPFSSPIWRDTSEAQGYDPGTAERLLKELGWRRDAADGLFKRGGKPLGFELVYYSGNPLLKKIATSLWLQFQRFGIKVELASMEARDLLERRLRPLNYQLALFYLNAGSDPDFASRFLASAQIGDYNFSGYTNQAVDSLFAIGRRTFDMEKRKEIYRQIDMILRDERPMFPLVSGMGFVVASSRVKDLWPLRNEALLKSARYWKVKPGG